MAIFLTKEEIIEKFTDQAKCRISYKGHKVPLNGVIWQINWKQVAAITVLFEKPKFHIHNGDACYRDGVRIVVKGQNGVSRKDRE